MNTYNTYWPPLISGAIYHIYNRGNNRENIFYTTENVRFFLDRYTKYMAPVVETYAYCLLPNHFHLLARVKTKDEIEAEREGASRDDRVGLDLPSFQNLVSLIQPDHPDNHFGLGKCNTFIVPEETGELVSRQFRLMFMSYAKAINKQQDRVGSLFQKRFRRKPVASDAHLINLVLYIHANPQLHGLCSDFRDWTDSSYASFLSDHPTRLQRRIVLDWFGGKDAFVEQHQGYIGWKTAGDGWMEEE